MTVPRTISLPVIIGVWVITALPATYTCVTLPWLADYCAYYETQSSGAIQHAYITIALLRLHFVGVPILLAILAYGISLLRTAETSAASLAWYASISISVAAVWQTWVFLAERSLYVLLFPA